MLEIIRSSVRKYHAWNIAPTITKANEKKTFKKGLKFQMKI